MIKISQQGNDTTTILLTENQGKEIRNLLEQNIDCRFTTYCTRIGIAYTNIAGMLAGRKKTSVKTLNRLFSATNLTLECQIQFIIQKQTGTDANDADCTSLEEGLFLDQMEELGIEQLNEMES